jgi:hypothetical protein
VLPPNPASIREDIVIRDELPSGWRTDLAMSIAWET